jgi:hypothetical protein
MGRVFLVVQPGRPVARLFALKRPKRDERGEGQFSAMFRDESDIAARIIHPNVVRVHEIGEDATGPFILMDYVHGVSVGHLLRTMRTENRLLPVQLCVRIVQQVAEGLHAAHELRDPDGRPLGVIHRDIAPANILMGYDGLVRLTDFGIANAYTRTTKTSTGVLKGRIGYMAPEQLRFQPVDRRVDIYALGVVLFELLSGKRLHEGDDVAAIARATLDGPLSDIGEVRSDVPASLVATLFRMLAKDPEARFADARAVADALDRTLAELALVEDSVRIDTFLEETFGPAEDVSALLEAPALEQETATAPDQVHRTASARRTMAPRVLMIAAGALAVGVGGVAIGLGLAESPEEPTVVVPSAPVIAPAAVVPAEVDRVVVPAGTAPVPAAAADAPSEAAALAPLSFAPPSLVPPSPRVRRRSRGRRSQPTDMASSDMASSDMASADMDPGEWWMEWQE